MIAGGADAVLVETSQDLLQTKAALNGARRAFVATGVKLPLFVQVTVETTGTMLLGSEIGAALTALEPLGIDVIGLNCATGPAEMSEHLRYLSRHARIGLSCMPNAGLPELTADGARYPLTPAELADAHDTFTRDFGLSLGRRLLRDDARAHPAGGRTGRRPRGHATETAARTRCRKPLPARAVPPGHVVPVDRRAHERQRLEGVPRRDARGRLGRLRRDRPRPDPRRRPPARRLRRLRRPRRRARHARGRRSGSRPRRRCRWCSTRPSRP